jgi:hypothetical protein
MSQCVRGMCVTHSVPDVACSKIKRPGRPAAEINTLRACLTEARQWLRDALAAGPRSINSLQQEAAAHGHWT